jgi:hypothetical protein
MKPTIGRIVHYKISEDDAETINRRRQRSANAPKSEWGFQAHVGNPAEAGQVFPASIVQIFGDTTESAVNLQVTLDGNDTYWATSRTAGDGDGQWSWPPRA